MAVIKCKVCGGSINLLSDKTIGICDYCGSTITFPKIDDEQRAAAFNRGNDFRRMGEFDKALGVYERIIQEDDTDAEAHWCCALCRFGIEYVEDPATYEWLPTCHRLSFDSFLEDVDYKAALENSDGVTRRQYQKDAAKIAEVQHGILATSQNTEPYDVFICYKETDESGQRTKDSLLAQDIYYQLTEQGRRVFFSRITLEEVPGTEYEPYIFAALNSAKVMVVVGTKAEYLNAVWVKNEWSRFLSMMRKDRSKLLLPCYRDMDPYDLPEQLAVLQSYDMAKIGFIQDLTRGVNKVLAADEVQKPVKETVVIQGGNLDVPSLVERGNIELEDKNWDKAKEIFDLVLNSDPKCAEAYLGLFMAEQELSNRAALKEAYACAKDKYADDRRLGRARQYASGELLELFEEIDVAWEQKQTSEAEIKKEKIAYLAPIRQRIKPAEGLISRGRDYTVGLRSDGTAAVESTGYNGEGQCDVSGWRDIVAISAGYKHTVGLHSDGTVVAVGENKCGRCYVSDWRDIVAISAGNNSTVGLHSDGTVVATGSEWHGECDVSGWRDIVAIAAGAQHTVGLRSDGTVVAIGCNTSGECDVSGWRDIVAIAAGNHHTVGLRSDGTVVAIGCNTYGECDVSDWRDIVAVAAGDWHTVGLQSNGTVMSVGSHEKGQCNVSDWRDIVAISAGDSSTVGLRSDGTVVAVWWHGSWHSDVYNWKLFNSLETLKQEREEEIKRRRVEEECRRAEEERWRAEEAARKQRLKQERNTLQHELANLRGLFTGQRRREIESRLREIEKLLK